MTGFALNPSRRAIRSIPAPAERSISATDRDNATVTAVDGGALDRVFDVRSGGTLTLVGITFVAALICFVLVITIPFGLASLRIGVFALWPFGRTVVRRPTADRSVGFESDGSAIYL